MEDVYKRQRMSNICAAIGRGQLEILPQKLHRRLAIHKACLLYTSFVYNPVEFNKYSDKEFLQYCPGAVMYMPGTRNFSPKILEKSVLGLTTLVLCLEDACCLLYTSRCV